jgi:hypothetical protein
MSKLNKELEKVVEDLRGASPFGAYVGRFCPTHTGHQVMMEVLQRAFPGPNHLLCIGSCNKPLSIRHLFDYEDRRDFIRILHPKIRIVPLPDFVEDSAWFAALDDLLRVGGMDPAEVTFIGGCQEDVQFFFTHGRRVHIVNRFDGMTTNVSGQEIRDGLIHGRSLENLLDARIIPSVEARFKLRWNQLRNT